MAISPVEFQPVRTVRRSAFSRYRWGEQNKEYACGVLAAQIPGGHPQGTQPDPSTY